MTKAEILQTARELKSVAYKCDELKHLKCDQCHFKTLGCNGLGQHDRLVDRIIEKVDDVIRKASDVDKVLTESISIKQTNKYHLIRR